MGLLDEVAHEAASNRRNVCTVGVWLSRLDQTDRTEVDEVLKSGYAAYTICRVLQRHFPNQFGERTFIRHMRGECCCVAEG